jgi:hypothetical protein
VRTPRKREGGGRRGKREISEISQTLESWNAWEVRAMRLQVCRMVYEDAEGIGPEDVVSLKEATTLLGLKAWSVGQLVDDGELTLLVDADAPKGWAWRFLLLRSEVEALIAARGERSPGGSRRRTGRRRSRP